MLEMLDSKNQPWFDSDCECERALHLGFSWWYTSTIRWHARRRL